MLTLAPWRITLFGGLAAQRDHKEIVRFQTRKTGGLLAYLAYHLNQNHPRDVLIEQIWPELDAVRGRGCLSSSVYSLRRQLEPLDVPPGSVIVSTKLHVRLNPLSVSSDIQDFALAIKSAQAVDDPTGRLIHLRRAIDLYKGELMPECSDDWITEARDRMSFLFGSAVGEAIRILESTGAAESAMELAIRASAICPDDEETHYEAIRLLRSLGKDRDAIKQFRNLESWLAKRWEEQPSKKIRSLVEGLERSRTGPRTRLPRAHVSLLAPPQEVSTNAEQRRAPLRAGLPVALTRFFGREAELERIVAAITEGGTMEAVAKRGCRRVFSLVGPAGSGKTRLAIEAAHLLFEADAGEVFFVPLADAASAECIPDAILRSAGVSRSAGEEAITQVCSSFEERRIIIVLDNLEHLPGCEEVVHELVCRLSRVSVLVTSRSPLSIAAEQVYPVLPLPVPSMGEDLGALNQYASVRMFVDRAQAVSPDFQLTRRNAQGVAHVCRELEGIPLAIELAAARASALSPNQIAAELTRRFEFLVSRQKCVEPRHSALRTSIAWSFDLLEPQTQRFFKSLAIFRGGWSLEAARAVCADDALDCLEDLVKQSLVIAEDFGDAKRYRILESLREFLMERLGDEERQDLENAHIRYFLSFAEAAALSLHGPGGGSALRVVDAERDNLLEMLAKSEGRAEGLPAAVAMWRYWAAKGLALEGREWLTRMLARDSSGSKSVLARALHGLAAMHQQLGKYDQAEESARSGLAVFHDIGDRAGAGFALNLIGAIADDRGDRETALLCFSESLEIFQAVGERCAEAAVLNNLGRMAHHDGDLEISFDYYQKSQAIYKEEGDWSRATQVLLNLGLVAAQRGDYAKAIAAYEQTLDAARILGDLRMQSLALHNLGDALYRNGNYLRAENCLIDSIKIRRERGDAAGLAFSFRSIGCVLAQLDDPIRGARLFAASGAIREKHGLAERSFQDLSLEEDENRIRGKLTDQDFDAAVHYGRGLSLEQAIKYALEEKIIENSHSEDFRHFSPFHAQTRKTALQ
jgi:predicted ATPase/DNA-binding SARP family transcriptional activator